jgi:hypothetical protein
MFSPSLKTSPSTPTKAPDPSVSSQAFPSRRSSEQALTGTSNQKMPSATILSLLPTLNRPTICVVLRSGTTAAELECNTVDPTGLDAFTNLVRNTLHKLEPSGGRAVIEQVSQCLLNRSVHNLNTHRARSFKMLTRTSCEIQELSVHYLKSSNCGIFMM